MTNRWVYTFVAWPDEKRGWSTSFFDLFDHLDMMIEVIMSEEDFDHFRNCLKKDGMTLRDVERVPYHEPESVL